MVTAWIGVCVVVYAYVTVLPIRHKVNLLHDSLSAILFCVTCVRNAVFGCPPQSDTTMPRSFVTRDLVGDRHRSEFTHSLVRTAEECASGLSSDIDHRALSWTLDSLDEEDLEQFFNRVPSFCGSSALDNPVDGSIGGNRKDLNSFAGLMDRTPVPDSVKRQRITICTKVLTVAKLFRPRWIVPRVFLDDDSQAFLRTVDFGLFLKDCSRVDRPIATHHSQSAVAVMILSVQAPARDDRWVQLVARQINVSKSSARSCFTYGDSILLANLFNITGKTIRASSHIGRHCGARIKNASSWTLESICKLDARDSFPGPHHDFCELWNELVDAARHWEHPHVRNISLALLKNTRKVYTILHEGTDTPPSIDDSDAALHDISPYPMRTVDDVESVVPGEPFDFQEQPPARNDCCIQLVAHQINVSKFYIQSDLIHGYNLPLANLVSIIGKTLRASADIGRHYKTSIKNVSSKILESIYKRDVRDSSPDQRGFRMLCYVPFDPG